MCAAVVGEDGAASQSGKQWASGSVRGDPVSKIKWRATRKTANIHTASFRQVGVAHAFNLSTRWAEAGGSL